LNRKRQGIFMHHIVIVGATSLIAEHCARLWVKTPVQLSLIGRDSEHLLRIATDLNIRSPESKIHTETLDFLSRESIERLATQLSDNGSVDILLVAHGSLPDQKRCENNLELAEQTLLLNGISPLLFAETFAKQMAVSNKGCIAVIGSVAGDRGRRSNYIYGAAKGFVDRYLEGMRHRFAGTPVKIITIKPGPTKTPMTTNLPVVPAGMATPEKVAADIVSGIAAGKSIIYTPGKWRLIMLVIRHLPVFVFNRMNI
jgi:decaprenylphospho-beta-D-erythro-pentofuranosid-2-ulose 2-reductase